MMRDRKNDRSLTCPNGHDNPADWQLCGECGTPLTSADSGRAWDPMNRAALAVTLIAATMIVGLAVTLAVIRGGVRPETGTAQAVTVAQWWSETHGDFTDLRDALGDARHVMGRRNREALESACKRMHEAAAVKLPAHLPAPDMELTNRIRAAAADAHEAAHMCLAVITGSINSYDGEFVSYIDQAETGLDDAQDTVNRYLTQS